MATKPVLDPPRLAELHAFTIEQFCLLNNISLATYKRLVKAGEGPELMRIRTGKVLISAESARRWRRSREKIQKVGGRGQHGVVAQYARKDDAELDTGNGSPAADAGAG
jgi:hypothetical protein